MIISLSNISVGDFAEIEKKMTFDMIKSFALISQDFNPIHLNEEYAANSRFKKRIIPGMLVGSLFSGLFGTNLPGEGCIYKSQNLRFKRAIYIGDVIRQKLRLLSFVLKKR